MDKKREAQELTPEEREAQELTPKKVELTPEEREGQAMYALTLKENALLSDLSSCDLSEDRCQDKALTLIAAIKAVRVEKNGFTQKEALSIASQIAGLASKLSESQRDYLHKVATDLRKKKQYSFYEGAGHSNSVRDMFIMNRYVKATGTK